MISSLLTHSDFFFFSNFILWLNIIALNNKVRSSDVFQPTQGIKDKQGLDVLTCGLDIFEPEGC